MSNIWTRRRKAGVVLGAIAALGLTACGGGVENDDPVTSERYDAQPSPATTDVEQVSWNSAYGEPTTLDPVRAFNNQNMAVIANMCEPLMTSGPDGGVTPNLAESMETSEDGLTYTLKIREGVTFWDGSPMTTEDVVWSLDHARDPDSASFLAGAMAAIQTVKAQDDSVIVTLSKPNALLPKYFAMQGGVVVSKSFATQAGAEYGNTAAGIMCTGPYEWPRTGWTTGSPLTLTRNDDYWTDELPLLTKQIRFEFITDTSTMVNAYKAGDVDGGFQIPGSAINSLQSADGEVYYARGSRSLNLITVGNDSAFAEPAVRRALSLAIDRQEIVDAIWAGTADVLRASAPPTSWLDAPTVYEAAWEELGGVDGDLDAARAELEGVSGLEDEIHIAIPAETENYVKQGEELQSIGEELGLTIVLDQMPTAEYGGLFADPEARAGFDALFIELPVYIPEPVSVYQAQATAEGIYNYSQFNSSEVTNLIEQAVAESDPTKRAELTAEVQAHLSEDLPWIPLVAPDVTLFLRNGLGGQVLTSNTWYPFAAYLGGA